MLLWNLYLTKETRSNQGIGISIFFKFALVCYSKKAGNGLVAKAFTIWIKSTLVNGFGLYIVCNQSFFIELILLSLSIYWCSSHWERINSKKGEISYLNYLALLPVLLAFLALQALHWSGIVEPLYFVQFQKTLRGKSLITFILHVLFLIQDKWKYREKVWVSNFPYNWYESK